MGKMFVFGALLALGCAQSDPYAGYRTSRLVFSAPDELLDEVSAAAEEWSAMTGLDVRVDNSDQNATPVELVSRESLTYLEESGRYASGESPMHLDPVTGDFLGCAVLIGIGQSAEQVAATVRHEMGHCLSGAEGHPDTAGCVMSKSAAMSWCNTDVEFVCNGLGC